MSGLGVIPAIIVKSKVLTHVCNMEINFFPKPQISNFPFIYNLKKPACASKRDGLVRPTLP